ncbi:MAG: phage holin family protein [Opitutales bacterium]|nr:phage holin family protein [Opitutales bacterium]
MNTMRSLSLVGRAIARLIEMRVCLFAAEFQLERMRFIRCLVLSILGATLLGTAVLAATALLVMSVAEENRITALGVVAGLLFGAAALCIGVSLHYVFGGRAPFKASTDAIKEDGECLISLIKK